MQKMLQSSQYYRFKKINSGNKQNTTERESTLYIIH